VKRRRIARALGAGSGMLAAALFSTAVASADAQDFDPFGFYLGNGETVLGISGFPPLYQQVEGTWDLGVSVPGSPLEAAGFADADVSTFTAPGFSNTEYLITSTQVIQSIPSFPTDGSVYDFATFGGFTNLYSDLVGGTAGAPTDTITDTLVTPFGSIDLSPLFESFATSVDSPGIVFGSL
jgi:hypothetical protein